MTSHNPILSPVVQPEDVGELSIRPKRLREFIGQPKLKENIQISLEAARQRKECLDHVLLCGPPGLGKTTLSHILANEMEAPIRVTSGPAIERPGDLAAILTNQEKNGILFVDEIHRLPRTVEEILYPAMEDFQLDLIVGKGPSARTLRLPVERFTLVGATTRAGLLSSPLRERFGIVHYLEFYSAEDLYQIIVRAAKILAIQIEHGGAMEIAGRARGTPRIANRLLRRIRDYAQVKADSVITEKVASKALQLMGIDSLGLDDFDRRFLGIIIEKHDGGPVGIETLSAAMSEERDTIEDVYEPYLVQIGLLNRTPRGRIATRSAFQHLGLTSKMHNADLFGNGKV